MNSIRYESIRQNRPGRAVALLLSAAMLSSACSAGFTDDAAAPSDDTAAETAPLRIDVTTTVQGAEIHLDMELDRDGDRLTGLRTITHEDGTVESEPFEESLAAVNASGIARPAPGGGYTLPAMGDARLELVDAQTYEGGAHYVLRAPDGGEMVVSIEGDTGYAIQAAGVILGSIGIAALIALCGYFTYRSMDRCADQNKCWEFAFWGAICTGRCRRC